MSMVGFPLLLIPLAIYNIIVFLMPGVSLAEPIVKLTLMSGAEWPLTLSDMLLALGILSAAVRGHQGRAPRREISHRSSVVADRIRRRRRRISAVAAVRQLDLFPARRCWRWWISCRGLRCAPGAGRRWRQPRRGEPGGPPSSRPNPSPNLNSSIPTRAGGAGSRFGRRIGAAGPPPTENGPSRHCDSLRRRRRCRRRGSSPAADRRGQPMGRTNVRRSDDLPRPAAGPAGRALAGTVGGPCIRKRRPPQAARLRSRIGGRDQLRDKDRIRRPLPAGALRPLRRRDHRDQRDAGGLCLQNDAVIYRRLWSIGA